MERKEQQLLRRDAEVPTKTEPERQLGGPQSGFPPPFIIGQDLAPFLIVGIDFGTNFARVCTFAGGGPRSLNPYAFSCLVEDILKVGRREGRVVHSAKICLAEEYLIDHGGNVRTAGEVVTTLFRDLKKQVELSSQRLLAKAVISVPASFNHRQRKAVVEAAKDADVAVLGLINDSTATALHGCFMGNLRNGRYLCISGGTYNFEASIIDVQNKLIEIKACRSAHEISSLLLQYSIADALKDRLEASAEELIPLADKIIHEMATSSAYVAEYRKKTVDVTRKQFAAWTESHIIQIDKFLQALTADAGYLPSEINGVILSGGHCELEPFNEFLLRRFSSAQIHKANVTAGAALYAALLVRQAKDWVVWDVLSSPTMVAQGQLFRQIIASNSPLPINGHASLTIDEQGGVTASVLQPGSSDPLSRRAVANLRIVEPLQAPAEETAVVDLMVTATPDGILSFSARHKVLDVNLTVEETTPPIHDQAVLHLDNFLTELQSSESPQAETGIEVDRFLDAWLITDLRAGSPAEKASLRLFDQIIAVDGRSASELGDRLPSFLTGGAGESRQLTIVREGRVKKRRVDCALLIPTFATKPYYESALSAALIKGEPVDVLEAVIDYARCLETSDESESRLDAIRAWEKAAALAANHPIDGPVLAGCAVLSKLTFYVEVASRTSVLGQSNPPHPGISHEELLQSTTPFIENSLDELIIWTRANENLPAQAISILYRAIELINGTEFRQDYFPKVEKLALAFDEVCNKHKLPWVTQQAVHAIVQDGAAVEESENKLPHGLQRNFRKQYVRLLIDHLAKCHGDDPETVTDELRKFERCGVTATETFFRQPHLAARYYKRQARCLLDHEARAEPLTHEQLLDLSRQTHGFIIVCNSSKEAYRIAELLALRDLKSRPLTKKAAMTNLLAEVYAGLDQTTLAVEFTNEGRKLIAEGAKVRRTALRAACETFSLAKRFDSLITYCLSQLTQLKITSPQDLPDMADAYFFLARGHRALNDISTADASYKRLLQLPDFDSHERFRALEEYAKFLIMQDSSAAATIIAQAEHLGKTLGLLTDAQIQEWQQRLKSEATKYP